MRTRKINNKVLLFKTVLYRLIIIVVQAAFTNVVLHDWSDAFTLSILWNIINTVWYYCYDRIFTLWLPTTVQTKGCVVWLTGIPCSGKTTVAKYVQQELQKRGYNVEHLDGDIIRSGGLSDDLGFSEEDRRKNLRRVTFVSKLLERNNTIVLASFVSPYKKARQEIRDSLENMIEVHVNASTEVCTARDVKGMWAKAKQGIIKGFTGYDAPYEIPDNPQIRLDTHKQTVEQSGQQIINYLKTKKFI